MGMPYFVERRNTVYTACIAVKNERKITLCRRKLITGKQGGFKEKKQRCRLLA